LFKAILPDSRANGFSPVCNLLREIKKQITDTSEPVDISHVVGDIEQLLDDSISPKGYIIKEPKQKIDLSQVDFEQLRGKFKRVKKGIQLQRLKSAIESTLEKMMVMNRTRIYLYDKYQAMIADYNSGSKNIEELLADLIDFAQTLDEEEKRGVREGLSEEELAVFDLLTQPEPKLTPAQEKEVKRIAHDLLESLKREKLVIDWRKKQQTRASVKLCIEDTFDQLPEIYTAQLYQKKCEHVYQHIYDSYYGQQQSIYASAGGGCS